MKPAKLVLKEEVMNIRFPKTDVLSGPTEIKYRDKELERALALGNLEHGKVKITFLDINYDIYQVETTIWAITEESICLKGDLLLPKRAVLRLSY